MAAVSSVSIDEDKNKEIEIPRHDPRDKSKLWISKVEIHHNTMMEKIRGLVQVKLFEMITNDDNFFNGIEDDEFEIEGMDGQPKPVTESELLLAKKAQMLTNVLNAIMELPKGEILAFLTSSSLPSGLNRKSERAPEQQSEQTKPQSFVEFEHNNPTDKDVQVQNGENYDDGYNWILDCGDAWKDLPPVVRINAIELGYNQTSWDEDAQDLPVFRTLWTKLTPSQRTAAIFLGNYNQESWNEDARIMLMAGKQPPQPSLEDGVSPSTEEPQSAPKEDITIVTASTELTEGRFVDENDDDDMFHEFVSNFATETEEVTKHPVAPEKHEMDDEDAMMNEFLSNFGGAEATSTLIEIESEVSPPGDIPNEKDENEQAMMDEFLSNFVHSSKEESESSDDDNVLSTSSASPKENDDDDDAMMDEFLGNFVAPIEEEGSSHSSDKEREEKQSLATPIVDRVLTKDENGDDDSDVAMMDEFFSNFVLPNNKEEGDQKYDTIKNNSLTRNFDSPREDNSDGSDGSDEEQPLILTKPKESTMDRGFQGETSPLLSTSTETKNIASELENSDDAPSMWDTVSSYLYWIPVVVGLPAVYMLANGSNSSS